jgi:hypothetical protein
MAAFELPVALDMPYQSFAVQLEGAVFQVRLRYNTRAGHWAVDLSDAAGTRLISGIAVRLGVDLLSAYSDDSFPPGKLFAINWVDQYLEPDRDNFGADVSLVYEESL